MRFIVVYRYLFLSGITHSVMNADVKIPENRIDIKRIIREYYLDYSGFQTLNYLSIAVCRLHSGILNHYLLCSIMETILFVHANIIDWTEYYGRAHHT